MSNFALSIHVFLQISTILVVSRVAGWLGRRFFGQTQVVMEMMAGVVLGPSILGLVLPELQGWLFPLKLALTTPSGEVIQVGHPAMSVLYVLSQLGLALYMFLVGLDFDPRLLAGKLRGASAVSGAGILAPFVLGALLAIELVRDGGLFAPGVSLPTAALFLGASMSITAFPVLARILREHGIATTRLGTLALTAGSVDDAIAWSLFAVVLAIFRGDPWLAAITIGGGLLYTVAMLTVGRDRFRRIFRDVGRDGLSAEAYTIAIIVLMLSAVLTDWIGIHAVFGAFVCGAAMPRGAFVTAVSERTERLATTLLLPVFFTYSGLNTRLELVSGGALWGLAAIVIVVAIVGKGVACTLAARFHGEPWRHAATIGVLMNARGLMELILLNIGLEIGLITPTLFTILALMALVTTLMASPLYRWIAPTREELAADR